MWLGVAWATEQQRLLGVPGNQELSVFTDLDMQIVVDFLLLNVYLLLLISWFNVIPNESIVNLLISYP